jgi:hypothetical protein
MNERNPSLRMTRSVVATMGLTLATLSSQAFSAFAQDDDSAGGVKRCVSLHQIDRTKVVDDDTVLFFLKGGDVVRNDLLRRCPTLMSENTFMYRTSLEQLCNSDTITVLNDVGFGFLPGATCGLGDFEPITEDEADTLEDALKDAR